MRTHRVYRNITQPVSERCHGDPLAIRALILARDGRKCLHNLIRLCYGLPRRCT